ncbi:MAG TPA: hypothetical protein VGM56_18540 [Byssovorax sp.]|jgi:hypothetical protein
MRRLFILASLLVAAAACGSSTVTDAATSGAGGEGSGGGAMTGSTTGPVTIGSTTTGMAGGPSTTYPAFTPSVPTVAFGFGPVLASPQVYPVFFPGDDSSFTDQLEDFSNTIGATPYWAAISGEYNVGAMVGHPAIQAPDAMTGTISDDDIQAYLEGKLNGDDPTFPTPDANTLIALYFPDGLDISLQGSQSCRDFGGYHSNITLDSNHGLRRVAYSVVPRCHHFGSLSGIDAVTGAASHEYIEAATDPYPNDQPAYSAVDNEHIYWEFAIGGGEVGDMCAQQQSAFTKFDPFPYTVQRTWSNAAALAWHNPCVPSNSTLPYFNTAPETPDMINLINYMDAGVNVPVGTSKTIALDFFSDGPMQDWQIQVFDAAQALGGGQADLEFTLDRTSGNNGDRAMLTITSVAQSQFGADAFYVVSTAGDQDNVWIGLVGQQ